MSKTQSNEISEAWRALIRAACPRGVVDMPTDPEEKYFAKLYPRLRRALERIKGAAILYERDCSGEGDEGQRMSNSFSFDDDDWENGWLDAAPGISFSYHLFFVGLSDPAMQVDCDTEHEVDDQETMATVEGKETFGYAVGVSLLAPVAMVQVNTYDRFLIKGGTKCETKSFRTAG
jgi:hypothetical protein